MQRKRQRRVLPPVYPNPEQKVALARLSKPRAFPPLYILREGTDLMLRKYKKMWGGERK